MSERLFGPERAYLLLGHVLFAGLLALSVIHHVERTVHVDSAFQIFKWVQLQEVQIEAHRYTAVIPQLCVKLGKSIGFGLNALLLLASVAHVAIPYAIFLIAAYVLRAPWVAFATALSAVLCTRLTFYGIVLEANYLLSYPLLLAAVIEGYLKQDPGPASVMLTAACLGLVLLVHPVGFLLGLFVLVWYYLRHRELAKHLLVPVVLACAWGAFGRLLFPPSTYEAGLYGSAGSGVLDGSGSTNAALEFLLGHTWRDTMTYLPLLSLASALVILCIQCRKWSSLGLFLTGLLGYTALVLATYRAGESAMMMEKNFVPLAVIAAIPLTSYLAEASVLRKWWALVPLVAIIFIQFRGISFASRPAHERIVAVNGIVADARKNGHSKVAIPSAELDRSGYHVHWALPFEALLLSSLDGPDHSVTAIALGADRRLPTGHTVCLPPMADELNGTQLDRRYFTLPEENYVLTSTPKN